MRFTAALLVLLSLWTVGATAASPLTQLPLTGTVLAVVSPCELDVMVTRSTVSDLLPAGGVARLVLHGLESPERFDALYMEAYDLGWILASEEEVYFALASPLADEESRWPAYVYLDPGGFGLLNSFLLASGLVTLDPMLEAVDEMTRLLLDIGAAAKRAGVGLWELAGEE